MNNEFATIYDTATTDERVMLDERAAILEYDAGLSRELAEALAAREWAAAKVRSSRRVIYGKAERAIVAVLAGEKLTKLVEATEEQFPSPSEVKKAAPKRPKTKLVKAAKKGGK